MLVAEPRTLYGMSFTVRPGVVTGFVGPNGAGKSTTMRVILCLDAVDEGTALIEGQPYRSLRYPLKHVGSLPEAVLVSPGRRPAGPAPHDQAEDASHASDDPDRRPGPGDPGRLHPLRDRFTFALLWETGIRIGEALGLRHEDLAVAEGS
jgi:energy-coupling factor transporter ATP-binding protein EcfA2